MFVNLNGRPCESTQISWRTERAFPSRHPFNRIQIQSRRRGYSASAEPAEYVYQVVEGAVRSYKLLSDGRPPDQRISPGGRHLRPRKIAVLTASRRKAIVETTVRPGEARQSGACGGTGLSPSRTTFSTWTASNLKTRRRSHAPPGTQDVRWSEWAAFLLEMDSPP